MIARSCCRVFALLCLAGVAGAQHRVDPRFLYERVIAIVPVIGSGRSAADPKRPLFVPAKPGAANPAGILAFNSILSDDGRFAIVEYVVKDRAALPPILTDSRVIKAFQRGKGRRAELESEARKYRRDFNLDDFAVVLP